MDAPQPTTLDLLDTTLPQNRKELYYTRTVLPALLSADDSVTCPFSPGC